MTRARGRDVSGPATRGLAAVPRGVWVLGLVSMCMDLSSELIHSLLPLYMALGLGASTLTIGIIEGVAEAIALIVKVFSGVLSDFIRRRKALVVLGYGLAAVDEVHLPAGVDYRLGGHRALCRPGRARASAGRRAMR